MFASEWYVELKGIRSTYEFQNRVRVSTRETLLQTRLDFLLMTLRTYEGAGGVKFTITDSGSNNSDLNIMDYVSYFKYLLKSRHGGSKQLFMGPRCSFRMLQNQ